MRSVLIVILFSLAIAPRPAAANADAPPGQLEAQFSGTVRPFLAQHCVDCHGSDGPEADLDLERYSSLAEAAKDSVRWGVILEKLESGEMPPRKVKTRPAEDVRHQVVEWFRAARDEETRRNAGDPGVVLARRLSNAEYDNTIRDLTGVDIRPAREFPVDPANTAGFDNSGESLTMSPSLLNKYLQSAHFVASHLVLKPDGFVFAPHPMLAETDRDKYCVHRIIDFYRAQNTDYADYFEAAWRYRHRAALGRPDATLADVAAERKVSPRYLETVWAALEDRSADVGPLVKLQAMWQALPAPSDGQPAIARAGCEQMRQYVVQFRKKVEPRFLNITAGELRPGAQPLLIWKNVQYATHRMTFDPAQLQVEGEAPPAPNTEEEPGSKGEFGPGKTVLIENVPGDPDLVVPAGQRARYEAAFARFCRVFPDRFYMEERGRNYFDTKKDRGRYLNAGFHSLMGYFRDDQPLYELVLSDAQRAELDALWHELDFVASASARTYVQFCHQGQRGERSITQTEEGMADLKDREITSEARIRQLERSYLARAAGGDPRGIEAIKHYFGWMNANIRRTEQARLAAEPAHLDALVRFASRAYRRPLSDDEQRDVRAYYRSAREAGLDHEAAVREGIVSVLMSPDTCYRIELAAPSSEGVHRLSDYELASRLSYFLWSSMPDDALLARAAAGELRDPQVVAAEARRMLKDPRVRALAVGFGGNWLDFRRFDELATVDRDRFPAFTDELRLAMYEEPIRVLVDALQSNRSMLDLVYGDYTFVNPVLAKHYGMSISGTVAMDEWVRVDGAGAYGRGGLLPMAAFMTKNAPGLRTSPVKRGNWVVKNVLGERIPAPPPDVPELPQDEAKLDLPLRDVLERHRADPNCAACHARFDSFGLVFEGFGPVGERRKTDLAGRAIDDSATFPDGAEGTGLEGLRRYVRERRQRDFTDNLSRKMLAYALGRSPILPDELLIREIDAKLARDGYNLHTLVEGIVTSPQFLNKRGRARDAER